MPLHLMYLIEWFKLVLQMKLKMALKEKEKKEKENLKIKVFLKSCKIYF